MFNLPEEIKVLIGNEAYSIDDVGMSDSTVILFQDKILKIQTISEQSENEHIMMKWLQSRLPVPKVLGFARDQDKNYLLMSKSTGKMSCEGEHMEDPKELTAILAEGLKMLWRVDISNCPYTCTLEKKLQMAKYIVENNLVDMDNVEPETFGSHGFKNPEHLLEWLMDNQPEEEMVLSHGDFCLPNIFLTQGKVSGYIDLGTMGIADKWQDIALCYRSLLHNYEGRFGGKKYEGFYKEMLFEQLGIEPDWDKIRYYIFMDELF